MSIKLFFPLNFNCNENNDKRFQASERQQSIDYSLIPSFNFVCNCRISVFCFSVLSNRYIRRIPKVYINPSTVLRHIFVFKYENLTKATMVVMIALRTCNTRSWMHYGVTQYIIHI